MATMLRKLLLTTFFIASIVAAFWVGRHFPGQRFLASTRYVTTQPLTLYSNAGEDVDPGVLPQGVTLYDIGGPDEFPHFVLIVGTKALSKMRPAADQGGYVRIPAEAAVE